MKVVAVNIAFRDEAFYKRWRLLAKDNNWRVTLVGPKYYEYRKFGPTIVYRPEEIDEDHFRVRQVDMRPKWWLRHDWWSWKYLRLLINEAPDVVYLVGYETKNVALLTVLYRILFRKAVKIGVFSMRGIDMPLHGLEYRMRWRFVKKHINFINVHYPHGRRLFREQGKFSGIINLQTQIGIDRDVFHPSETYREMIRSRYGISSGTFVFGAAIRLEESKGVFDIIDACSDLDIDYTFLLLGDGRDVEEVRRHISERGLEARFILPGKVPYGEQVCMHLNAMDCFVHVPKTTRNWVDTFPLAVVQAMACGLPVIASNSGAMAYQTGADEWIVEEGNSIALREAMQRMASDRINARELGEKMLLRVLRCFEIRHLNRCLTTIFSGCVAEDKVRMSLDQTEAAS